MKIKFYKKIISLTLIISFIIPSILFSFPQKTNAAITVQEVGGNLVQNTMTAISTMGTAVSALSLQLKEYVLDPIASGFAKMVIRQITSSVVNWINSGFQGSPSFVQNPGAFFLDVADQITGDFLFKTNSPLSQLCSPFSIDIRLALAFKYRPNVQRRYTCTLGRIIQNSQNAVRNASINGFTAGDFRQGGWPAFVSLTTEPQNNIYGAYLQAESELSFRVASAQQQKRDEISQGRGFLSWEKCRDVAIEGNIQGTNEGSGEGELSSENANTGSGEGVRSNTEKKCEIQTPGSVIAGALDDTLGGPLKELQLADEINEIVNALFAQLVTQVLSAGLGGSSGVSGSGTSDLNSYINRINNDVTITGGQMSEVRSQIIHQIDNALVLTNQYRTNRNNSLNLFINVRGSFDSARACYIQRIQGNINKPISGPSYESRVSEIDSIVSTQVTPTATRLLGGAREADGRVTELQSIRTAANNARTLNDINTPSQQFSAMVQAGRLTNAMDVQNSREEYDQTQTQVNQLNQTAQRMLQECQIGY